jgi:hypothetical protein
LPTFRFIHPQGAVGPAQQNITVSLTLRNSPCKSTVTMSSIRGVLRRSCRQSPRGRT